MKNGDSPVPSLGLTQGTVMAPVQGVGKCRLLSSVYGDSHGNRSKVTVLAVYLSASSLVHSFPISKF